MNRFKSLHPSMILILVFFLTGNDYLTSDNEANLFNENMRIGTVDTPTGTIVALPVIVNAGSFVMKGFQANIQFDQNTLSASSSDLGTNSVFESSLLDDDILTFNVEQGEIKVAWNGAQNLTDGDTLGKINLYVKADTPVYTPVNVSFDETEPLMVLNENGDVVTIAFVDGAVNPVARIGGSVKYWSSAAAVKKMNVKFSHVDTSYEVQGDENGQFNSLLLKKMMDISAERLLQEDDRPALSVADIVKLQRVIVGLDDPFSGSQFFVADVNEDSQLTVQDGFYIERFVLGELQSVPAGAWKLIPSDETSVLPSQPDSVLSITATGDTSGVNFTALLFGDINGSWSDLSSQSLIQESVANRQSKSTHKIPVEKFNDPITFQLDLSLAKDTVKLELWSSASDAIAGFQLPIIFEDPNIELLSVKSEYGEIKKYLKEISATKNEAMFLWYDVQNAVNAIDDVQLATIVFRHNRQEPKVNLTIGKFREWVNSNGNPITASIWFKEKLIGTDIEEIGNEVPDKTQLIGSYPNPFNPSTNIEYKLSESSDVEINVYDSNGRKVATLVNQRQAPGSYSVRFNAENLSSGVYLYRLNTESYTESKKMLFIK